ncbi:hypothetical protein BD309DRAFT_853783 [Dichomitus squalens]|uniref:Uncharacterized protein n=1 Tax=Dichomitus squalens TaxID=114155 RepID=A0A4Q9P4B9_9APHY|nr:uncharacterized protein DICSQDRAFT_56664 [Dichomitus squalens LYAD-421 SS1]EJF62944.1 hypothetical protein DICSQDRAFT_56664 [Dichomitus squalens LYAD-421 SS1]TBU32088.1 hypothetical protein BD311DRAFT_775637 [Dichomitus squalens]TBU48465.1 hypothetical protein BD309DRAFT_853783 [Dichomitus squalens]
MAKSTRSKVKRHFRAKKREQGVYAATEAARLHRLNMKLKVLITTEKDEETPEGDAGAEGESGEWVDDGAADAMDLDPAPGPSTEKKISTHGPRNSRREQWRASKGLPARPKSKGTNRQGGIAARRKAGRPSRRR